MPPPIVRILTTPQPLLYDYEPDVEIIDSPCAEGTPIPHVVTKVLDLGMRAPAPPVERFPITAGLLNGAPVEQIADSLVIGECWIVGPAPYSGPTAIWLTHLDLPYRDQVAAWRARGPRGLS